MRKRRKEDEKGGREERVRKVEERKKGDHLYTESMQLEKECPRTQEAGGRDHNEGSWKEEHSRLRWPNMKEEELLLKGSAEGRKRQHFL